VLRVGVGLSRERDSARAAAEAATCALRSAQIDRADLLLVFATTPHGPGFTRVTRTAAEICETRNVVGCSAAGVLAGEEEVEAGPAVAVLVLRGGVTVRRFFVPITRGRAEHAAEEIATAVGEVNGPDPLLLLFADSYHLEPEPLFRQLGELLPTVRAIGGGASEDGSVGQVSVFSGDTASSGAVAGALIQGDVSATVGVAHAVRRVSPVHTVTKVYGNWALELDGRPAYEKFAAVVPAPLLQDTRRALAVVLAGLPVSEDDFVSRHLVGLDVQQGAVAVATQLAVGQELFFGVRDPSGARDDLQRVLARQSAAWSDRPAAGALYINCVGRGRSFYGLPGLDTAYIRQQLGPLPVAGFFSGAEFAPGAGVSQLHQYTGVLAMLGSGT
jgi:small ligand-binding sensory domain FIST